MPDKFALQQILVNDEASFLENGNSPASNTYSAARVLST